MALPHEWELKQSLESPSRVYYYNQMTNQSTWIRPIPYPGTKIEWPPLVSIQHILVGFKDCTETKMLKSEALPTRTKEKAQELINQFFQDIISGNKKIEELIKEKSDGKPERGWMTRGKYCSEFEEVAWSLDIGELSAPFETSNGFHIIFRNG